MECTWCPDSLDIPNNYNSAIKCPACKKIYQCRNGLIVTENDKTQSGQHIPIASDENISNKTDNILFLAGIIIIGFNFYWLSKWDFSWNIFTYESWFMLVVGFLLAYPLYSEYMSDGLRKQKQEYMRLIKNNSAAKVQQSHEMHVDEQNPVGKGDPQKNESSVPDKDAIGNPDDDGYEWVNSEDGRNWYRTQGSSEDWIEFSN